MPDKELTRMDGLQSRSGYFGEKNSLPVTRIEPRFLGLVEWSTLSHFLRLLYPRQRAYEDGWAPEQVWIFWRKEKFFVCDENRTSFPRSGGVVNSLPLPPAALSPTKCLRGWMGSRAGLDILEKRKILCL
jgi:hypothetical protein